MPKLELPSLDEQQKSPVTVESYGEYASSNYGLNTLMIDLGVIRLYYSYQTIVAFYTHETDLVCSRNRWSTTTGKHIHWIQPDKTKQTDYATFQAMLSAAIAAHIH